MFGMGLYEKHLEGRFQDFLGIRGFIHFGLFLICFYFGFVKKSAT
jgi:hypothetical protein